jgi:hypothetical protein
MRTPEGMAAAGAREGEELLLRSVEAEDEGGGGLCMGERPWRLNFDGFRRLEAQQELARGLQDFLGVLGCVAFQIEALARYR